jgi:putative transposase
VIRIPPRSPKANAFVENWIGGLKRECLNFFLCFSLDQLHYITQTGVRYYNTLRPLRGIELDNQVLDEQFKPQRDGPVRCREQLGGLIKSYYREAA